MHNLILIERDPPSYKSWPSLIQKNKIPELSVQEVVTKYQGFEGELICFFEVNEDLTKFKKNLTECLKIKELGSCFLLHIVSNSDNIPPFMEGKVIKLGYDVGVCEEEKTVYSSIFHEVIFGYFEELVAYKDILNENFLFPDRSSAENYVKTHDEMSAQGKDVEDYMEMIIYEVWKQKD